MVQNPCVSSGRQSENLSREESSEEAEEDSAIVSEHLHQLGCRLELSFQRYHTSAEDGDRRNWSALDRQQVLTANEYSQCNYVERFPAGGTIRSGMRGSDIMQGDGSKSVDGGGSFDFTRHPQAICKIDSEVEAKPVENLFVEDLPNESSSGEIVSAVETSRLISPSIPNQIPGIDLSAYLRIVLPSRNLAIRVRKDTESFHAVHMLTAALNLRNKFTMKYHIFDSRVVFPRPQSSDYWGSTEPIFRPQEPLIMENVEGYTKMVDGVCLVYSCLESKAGLDPLPLLSKEGQIPSVGDYLGALKEMMRISQFPSVRSLCFQRLRYLEQRFNLHVLLNGAQEIADTCNNNHRDFYNVRKVDTHVHHSACMTQKHLLRFIRKKYRLEGETIVASGDAGEKITLAEIFQKELDLTAWETSIDHLNVHALNSCFHRFDLFNTKYNPFGTKLLREVFLKTDNYIGGRYLAELTREVIEDLEEHKYQHVEWRVSIYGHSKNEWLRLGQWLRRNNLYSKNVRWVIQVPRLYHIYRRRGVIKSMEDFLSNIFQPVFDAVLRPEENDEIWEMLQHTVAWDSVDDESVVSKFTTSGTEMQLPQNWVSEDNPPYAYWMYYMYANIRSLNILLQARGINAMPFRPHCGEAGSISHLATAGLLADGINHGIVLRKSPVLQYLFYLWQIGIAMSPLSNNALFHEITKSPVKSFFQIGLNVSLSSDDPLMFHFTDEALLEEYSVCAHVWKFSPVDLCELARNSVLQSNYEAQFKRHWLGPKYYKKGPRGDSVRGFYIFFRQSD